jgi:hypothetical protein
MALQDLPQFRLFQLIHGLYRDCGWAQVFQIDPAPKRGY